MVSTKPERSVLTPRAIRILEEASGHFDESDSQQTTSQLQKSTSQSQKATAQPQNTTAQPQNTTAQPQNTTYTPPTVQSSVAEVWYLKEIQFGEAKHRLKVITQNFNGPCSFIAICNILILRRDIIILPPSRTTVSYEQLAELVGEYILTNGHAAEGEDIGAALEVMPCTQRGMDLNPSFTSSTIFHPTTLLNPLKLFKHANISLLHGWVVEPGSEASEVIKRRDAEKVNVGHYDGAVDFVVGADHVGKGVVVVDNAAAGPSSSSAVAGPSSSGLSGEDSYKVHDALVIRQFLESTASQLTYHGLFNLVAILKPGVPVALFRNSHLSVLYKPPGDESAIYTLVTDYVFLREPSVVWEKIEDVDGSSSSFVDSDFIRSSPAGGDFAGQTAEEALSIALQQTGISDPTDEALAHQLQAEEDAYGREQQHLRFQRKAEEARVKKEQQDELARKSEEKMAKKKNGKDCVIM